MDRARWQRWVVEGAERHLNTRTLACFNANVDVVAHLEPEVVHTLIASVTKEFGPLPKIDPDTVGVRSVSEFLALLKESLRQGKSTYAVLEDVSALNWFDKFFTSARRAVGGQAGIIGNQMAALGAHSTVYTPILATTQAELLHPDVCVPVIEDGALQLMPASQAASSDALVKVNWIFEYPAGLEFDFDGEIVRTPRANRVIVATRPAGLEMSFCGQVASHVSELAGQTDVAFMAGYHYASANDFGTYLDKVTQQLEKMRSGNQQLRMHYEYVPAKAGEIESELLTAICERVDSFGINEHEIIRALALFGLDDERMDIEDEECAYTLYRGGLALLRRLGVSRIQVHNLGYYVMILNKPYATSPQVARQAALFGSTVNAAKAKFGGIVTFDQVRSMRDWPLSDIGFNQLERMAERPEVERDLLQVDDGIWEGDDHWVLVVPAHVVPNPVSTVGMGDTVSSSSFAREVELSTVVTPHMS